MSCASEPAYILDHFAELIKPIRWCMGHDALGLRMSTSSFSLRRNAACDLDASSLQTVLTCFQVTESTLALMTSLSPRKKRHRQDDVSGTDEGIAKTAPADAACARLSAHLPCTLQQHVQPTSSSPSAPGSFDPDPVVRAAILDSASILAELLFAAHRYLRKEGPHPHKCVDINVRYDGAKNSIRPNHARATGLRCAQGQQVEHSDISSELSSENKGGHVDILMTAPSSHFSASKPSCSTLLPRRRQRRDSDSPSPSSPSSSASLSYSYPRLDWLPDCARVFTLSSGDPDARVAALSMRKLNIFRVRAAQMTSDLSSSVHWTCEAMAATLLLTNSVKWSSAQSSSSIAPDDGDGIPVQADVSELQPLSPSHASTTSADTNADAEVEEAWLDFVSCIDCEMGQNQAALMLLQRVCTLSVAHALQGRTSLFLGKMVVHLSRLVDLHFQQTWHTALTAVSQSVDAMVSSGHKDCHILPYVHALWEMVERALLQHVLDRTYEEHVNTDTTTTTATAANTEAWAWLTYIINWLEEATITHSSSSATTTTSAGAAFSPGQTSILAAMYQALVRKIHGFEKDTFSDVFKLNSIKARLRTLVKKQELLMGCRGSSIHSVLALSTSEGHLMPVSFSTFFAEDAESGLSMQSESVSDTNVVRGESPRRAEGLDHTVHDSEQNLLLHVVALESVTQDIVSFLRSEKSSFSSDARVDPTHHVPQAHLIRMHECASFLLGELRKRIEVK